MHPEHGLAAPSHPDPYPYYRHLVANMPMHRDDRLGMWVAASADAIAAFGRYPSARTAPLHLCVEEVARFDAPVQNTRRFTASSVVIGGQEVGPGEEVLVVLAAANRDGAVNPHPEASIQYGGPHAASRLAWELMTAWANT